MEEHIFNDETETLLLANDSRVTRVVLHQKISATVSWTETFQRFYNAIVKSTVMDYLIINLEEIVHLDPGDGTGLLLRAVEECNSIKTIVINRGRFLSESRIFGSALLSAISSNKNIQECQFFEFYFRSQDLATFIRNSSSIAEVHFDLSYVDFNIQGRHNDSPPFNENVQELKDAFNQNTKLNNLSFGWWPMFTNNNRIILDAAKSSTSIEHLVISYKTVIDEQYNPQIFVDIATYLNESNVDVAAFRYMKWDNITFGALTSHLNCEADLMFYKCTFDKDASILLKDFLLSEHSVDAAVFFAGDKATFHDEVNVLGEIISKEKGPGLIDLSNYHGIPSPMNGLESICTGLASKTSELETLCLPCLSPTQSDCLLSKLPTFKNVRFLKFALDAESEHLKGNLFSAIRRNGCLHDTKIEAPWITCHDSDLVARFADRNRILPDLVKDISKVHKSAIPLFFYSSAHATSGIGPKDIVKMLTTLGDKVCIPDEENLLSSKQLRM